MVFIVKRLICAKQNHVMNMRHALEQDLENFHVSVIMVIMEMEFIVMKLMTVRRDRLFVMHMHYVIKLGLVLIYVHVILLMVIKVMD